MLLSELQHLLRGDALARVVDVAVAAERIGIDAVFMGEHVVMGEGSSSSGPPPRFAPLRPGSIDPGTPWLDPVVTLAAVAAMTETIGLGTAILIAPLRPAVLVATMAATLDVLAAGRLELGVGVSWQRAEYAALGARFAERGRRFDEALTTWPTLWSGEPVTVRVDGADAGPVTAGLRPHGGRDIPIWFGGAMSDRMIRRVVSHGCGLAPLPRASAEDLARLVAAMERADRDPDQLDLITGLRPAPGPQRSGPCDLAATLAAVPSLLEQGYTTFVLWPGCFADDASILPDVMAEARRRFAELTRGAGPAALPR